MHSNRDARIERPSGGSLETLPTGSQFLRGNTATDHAVTPGRNRESHFEPPSRSGRCSGRRRPRIDGSHRRARARQGKPASRLDVSSLGSGVLGRRTVEPRPRPRCTDPSSPRPSPGRGFSFAQVPTSRADGSSLTAGFLAGLPIRRWKYFGSGKRRRLRRKLKHAFFTSFHLYVAVFLDLSAIIIFLEFQT